MAGVALVWLRVAGDVVGDGGAGRRARWGVSVPGVGGVGAGRGVLGWARDVRCCTCSEGCYSTTCCRGGAVERMSGFLGRLEPEGEALALVVVVGVAPPFFESVTGFGVAGGDQRAYPARGGLLATSGRGAIELGAVRGGQGALG